MKLRCWLFALGVVLAVAATGWAQSSTEEVLRIDFTHPELTPSHWAMTIHPDGTGHFESQRSETAVVDAALQQHIVAPDVNRSIQLSRKFTERVFATARQKKFFGNCEAAERVKRAFQGWKLVSYSGAGGQWSCRFNFADSEEMRGLADHAVHTAYTLIEGAKLESYLQHDRLGLDVETSHLSADVANGHAEQLDTIRSILKEVADDPAVMVRVKRQVQTLLQAADAGK